MDSTLPAFALLACTVVALALARSRGMAVHIIVEASLVVAIAALLVWRGTSPLPHHGSVPPGLAGAASRALAVAWWLLCARLIVNVTAFARGRDPRARNARLFSDLAAGVIYIATALIVLNSVLDLNVGGLVVTSGVIAIVLGLALQNTLADVFSGIAVSLERPFQVGDEVAVGDGVEGVIVQINWRSVRIQTDGDDLATVPNSIVAKGTIINRSVPTRRRAATVEVVAPVHASSSMVMELMRQATLLCPAMLSEPAPSITIRRVGLRSVTYAARFLVADSPALAGARSQFLHQTRRLFRHAGVGQASALQPAELLGSLAEFSALSSAELDRLAETVVAHAVEPGDIVFEQGAPAFSLYVVAAGVMETSRTTPDDDLAVLARLAVGDVIGELGLVAQAPRAFRLKALTHGRVLELPGDCLAHLQRSNPGLDAAVQRSAGDAQALIDRDEAARAAPPPMPAATLLARARALLGI
jgi:small-conductance mechanosensitive channel/CRP-like cAMP-binding protein